MFLFNYSWFYYWLQHQYSSLLILYGFNVGIIGVLTVIFMSLVIPYAPLWNSAFDPIILSVFITILIGVLTGWGINVI